MDKWQSRCLGKTRFYLTTAAWDNVAVVLCQHSLHPLPSPTFGRECSMPHMLEQEEKVRVGEEDAPHVREKKRLQWGTRDGKQILCSNCRGTVPLSRGPGDHPGHTAVVESLCSYCRGDSSRGMGARTNLSLLLFPPFLLCFFWKENDLPFDLPI